jgi:hypothetical protein
MVIVAGGGTVAAAPESKSPGEAGGDDLLRHLLACEASDAKHEEIHCP